MEEQMAEEARHLNDFQASYQRLVDDSRKSKVITKDAEQVIATTQAAIVKTQALISGKWAEACCYQEKVGGARAAKKQIQENITSRSFKLESL